MDRHEISEILNEIGLLLELKGENFFKSKAYYDAARTLELLDEEPETLVRENRLRTIKGFGEALTLKMTELITTGRLEYLEKLRSEIPHGLVDMLRIPGLGSKKIRYIYENLGISTIGELKYACIENRLIKLPGFGEKSQAAILKGIENLGRYDGKHYFFQAEKLAEGLSRYLEESGLTIRCLVAGSLRRKMEIIGDIDIVASCSEESVLELMNLFTSYPLVKEVVSKGDTKSTVVLQNGINSDLRVVRDNEFPFALHHFTGSREHNTSLRHIARQNGLKMNEYGIFEKDRLLACKDETDIFKVYGMSFIPPELRENNGELEAAAAGKIPVLVNNQDIKGIFHVHTNFSDGSKTLEQMAAACRSKGYRYMGVSDHSISAYYAGGMKPDDIKRQHEEIMRLNSIYNDFVIYKGVELDILPDGGLDYNDEILASFDFTIISVHSSFKMDEDRMTERVMKALRNKYVTILGHPTGRLLLSREAFKINMTEIIRATSENKVILEINANPHRLDIDWRLCRAASEKGCRFAISPDAHDIDGIDDVRYGVNVAGKGWLTRNDIINTMDSGEMSLFLSKNKLK